MFDFHDISMVESQGAGQAKGYCRLSTPTLQLPFHSSTYLLFRPYVLYLTFDLIPLTCWGSSDLLFNHTIKLINKRRLHARLLLLLYRKRQLFDAVTVLCRIPSI